MFVSSVAITFFPRNKRHHFDLWVPNETLPHVIILTKWYTHFAVDLEMIACRLLFLRLLYPKTFWR